MWANLLHKLIKEITTKKHYCTWELYLSVCFSIADRKGKICRRIEREIRQNQGEVRESEEEIWRHWEIYGGLANGGRTDQEQWNDILWLFPRMFMGQVVVEPSNLKGVINIRCPFDSGVNAMDWQPYWPSRVEASYTTFRYGAIIRHNLCTLSLPHDSPHDNHFACGI